MKKKLKKIAEVEYNFTLEGFSGPLDLLLHLARSNEIEISNISLDTLIDQYLIFIDGVQENGVDVASTYLEMAAELIRLKSKMLLPNHDNSDLEFIEELEASGLNREQLIAKLLEYKKYKEVALRFDDLHEKRLGFYTKEPEKMLEYRQNLFQNSMDLNVFLKAAQNCIRTELLNKKEQRTIETHELGTGEYIEMLKTINDNFSFYDKIKNLSKSGMIALFLAILESLKLQYISFSVSNDDVIIMPYQGENYELHQLPTDHWRSIIFKW